MNKDNISVEYSKVLCQEEDCCGRPGKPDQYLKIQTIDNGVGSYIIFDTERWAITDKEEWYALWDNHIESMLKEANK